MQSIIQIIEGHTLPIVENLGLSLWGVEVLAGNKTLVRIYLDGAGIDECAKVSRLLGLVLDIEEPFSNAWVLEVSTPGIDRQFFSVAQLENFIGEKVNINFITPLSSCPDINGKAQKKVEAKIISVNPSADTFEIELENNTKATISWEDIKKIKLFVENIEINKINKK